MNCLFLFILGLFYSTVNGRKHHFSILDDFRKQIILSSFGFRQDGELSVLIESFAISPPTPLLEPRHLGFILFKTKNPGVSKFAASQGICNQIDHIVSSREEEKDVSKSVVLLNMDMKNHNLQILNVFGEELKELKFFNSDKIEAKDNMLPFSKTDYNISFGFNVDSPQLEGLYTLYFFNCHTTVSASFIATIVERNGNDFLSYGNEPLPIVYGVFALCFFGISFLWIYILCKSEHRIFKTHLCMLALCLMKSLAILFHAVNFHYIAVEGIQETAWAVLYYITYLFKGALMFISIMLIGAGWSFVKHVLSEREKKVFLVVIPLQILANICYIVIEESEQSSSDYSLWQEILIVVDLVCCGAILMPVLWSIRHLQEASKVDGKAAVNLQKLKLFRQFYLMIVAYIYFTRIIVYFLKATISFNITWVVSFSQELATLMFFIFTGYNFRPVADNPYMHLADESDEDDEDVLMSSVEATQVVKRNIRKGDDQKGEGSQSLLTTSVV